MLIPVYGGQIVPILRRGIGKCVSHATDPMRQDKLGNNLFRIALRKLGIKL